MRKMRRRSRIDLQRVEPRRLKTLWRVSAAKRSMTAFAEKQQVILLVPGLNNNLAH